MQWNNQKPIYLQLKELIGSRILDGSIKEGEAIPSIRAISSDFEVNPITVSKAINALVDDGVVEKKRGLGMFVKEGAASHLLTQERDHFIQKEWPLIKRKLEQLNISIEDLS